MLVTMLGYILRRPFPGIFAGASTVVDLGAGKGHLAGELASRHALSVLAVDVSDALVQHAGKQAQRGGRNECGKDGSGSGGGSVHVAAASALLTARNAVPVLQGLLCQQASSSSSSSSERGSTAGVPGAPLVLIGLHACGDLSPTVLRAFREWPAAAAVVSLGCCYNLLTEREPASSGSGGDQGAVGVHVPWHRAGATGQCCTTAVASLASDMAGSEGREGEARLGAAEPAGFPMSRHCQEWGMALGWAPRTAACHTNDRLLAAAVAGTCNSTNASSSSSSSGGGGDSEAAPGAAAAVCRAALNRLLQLHCPEVPLSSISLGRSSRVKRRQARPAGTRAAVGAGAAVAAAAAPEQGRPRGCSASAGATEAGFVQYVQGAAAKLGLEQDLPGAEELAKVRLQK